MKKLGILFLSLVMMFSLVACSDGAKEPEKSAEQTEDLKEVSIMLDWYPNAVHSFIYVAAEKGYFEEEGLNVKINMPAETSDPLKLVAGGKTTFAVSYQPEIVMARAKDIPVVSVASIVGHHLNTMMTTTDQNINSPKDLEGKTVGFSLPVYEAVAKTVIESDGGDLSKVEIIDIGFDLIPALVTKRVEATSGGFINHEQVLLEKEGQKIKTFNPVDYGVPDFYELVLVVSEDTAKNDQETVKKFWNAAAKGQAFVKDNPEEALTILLSHQNDSFPLEKEIEEKSLEILLPLMEDFGAQSLESYENVIEWMAKYKLIDKKPEAKDAFISL
ncbi:putative hydroxymethylpyrimidine transport system substrate-binding protein [Desulfonispora thiosulfatigenes DSM 11270]|uniref:Putative hydroxymethylpyrimidine transport system substrate-binding protein n=1 Tax=Desulfonispora thiosulfatigenes DSM 11270 TaxID=656914 RepID=A0A1W1UKL8_DESTI|nr:ABC transporter substrate-binding protein [Desulfonispora thiosulfatigenes]SMB81627.1 putative hydroxymethylpyrimidine transport system substrate-binding protein [Desulfonispora thiosulfatigenes DSM 11270]